MGWDRRALLAFSVGIGVAFAPSFPTVGGEILLPLPDLAGVRIAAMGDAAVGLEDAATGFFHNPANLGVKRGVVLFGQTNVTGRDDVEFDPKGISYRYRGWGLAWGNKIAQTDALADYTYISVGRRVTERLFAGVSGKFWRTHPSENFQVFGNSPTYDMGLMAAPTDETRVGVRVGQLRRGEGVEAVAVGASRKLSRFLLSAEGAWSEDADLHGRAGVEWRPSPAVAFRAGLRGASPTAGLGVRVHPFVWNVAVARVQETTTLFVGVNFILAK